MSLLMEARRAGLTVTTDGANLTVRGPKCAEAIVHRLAAHKPEIVDALGRLCDRCGVVADRVIVAYWGAKYCPECCALVVALNDNRGTWPPVPWDDRHEVSE